MLGKVLGDGMRHVNCYSRIPSPYAVVSALPMSPESSISTQKPTHPDSLLILRRKSYMWCRQNSLPGLNKIASETSVSLEGYQDNYTFSTGIKIS